MDKLLYHCLWAPKVPSVFCFACWGLDSANILLCPWLRLLLPLGFQREIEKQEEGRRNCLILMRHVSSVAGHLKQQEMVAAFNLVRHSWGPCALSDIPASPHIQSHSPGPQWLLSAFSLGFCLLITPPLPFVYPPPRLEVPFCIYYSPVTSILSFCSFSPLTPGKPTLYSQYHLLKYLVQFSFLKPLTDTGLIL